MHNPKLKRLSLLIARQRCACVDDTDCCAAPGQAAGEIVKLVAAVKKSTQGDLGVFEIRDVRIAKKFPQAAKLFKEYGYNCLPIIMLGQQVVAYGIPDQEFIINAIGKIKVK